MILTENCYQFMLLKLYITNIFWL